MSLTRQAKTLDEVQQAALLAHVARMEYAPARNVVIVRLSFEAWLRAKEIACARWRMVMDVSGRLVDVLRLEDRASKGRSGRVLRLSPTAFASLETLYDAAPPPGPDAFIVRFRKYSLDPVTRSQAVQALFRAWYRALGFRGATSHSGRRTGITKAARNLGPQMSLRDVQLRAGHTKIATTQRYIDPNPEADLALAMLSMIRPVMLRAALRQTTLPFGALADAGEPPIDAGEQQIMARVRELRAAGCTVHQIARQLSLFGGKVLEGKRAFNRGERKGARGSEKRRYG